MTEELSQRCRDLVVELGLGDAGDVGQVVPLTGGVASDIAMVDLGSRRICIKFALGKLKVAEDWRAPVHRNQAEYAWLRVAAGIDPDSAVELFGRSEMQHGFAMEFLDGNDVRLWKSDLLAGQQVGTEAARVGAFLGRIHAASTDPAFDTAAFQNRDDFRALRIEPYLTFTAGRHPTVRDRLIALAHMLYSSDAVLVHGDVSPKNILFRAGRPIILDAECATMGDPCFDLSFCLNHLVLKALHVPALAGTLDKTVHGLWSAYADHVTWEPATELEARVCRLVPALMLARIDGKSPVEYLDESERDRIRHLAIALIQAPTPTLASFVDALQSKWEGSGA